MSDEQCQLQHPKQIFAPGWHGDANTPVIDNKYCDRKTGKICSSHDHSEYSGPPAVDIIIKSQHIDTVGCCYRAARPFPVTDLVCFMMQVIQERNLVLDSMIVTTYAIRIVFTNEMTKEEFYEAAKKLCNGIWDS